MASPDAIKADRAPIPIPSQPSPGLHCVGTYRRRVGVSLARVFENALDWEHLPWLHAQDFSSIDPVAAGPWGWRARVGLRPESRGAVELELLVNREISGWVSRPYGETPLPGEIWTRARAVGEGVAETDLEIAFHLPAALEPHSEPLFAQYRALYQRLWDQDEEMAWIRERRMTRRPRSEALVELGPLAALRDRLPLRVEVAGRHFRIVELDGELVVHSAVCPHWLGPLDTAQVVDGCVTCPWHGYRFDVRSGKSADGRALALAAPPQLRIEEGRVVLEPVSAG